MECPFVLFTLLAIIHNIYVDFGSFNLEPYTINKVIYFPLSDFGLRW